MVRNSGVSRSISMEEGRDLTGGVEVAVKNSTSASSLSSPAPTETDARAEGEADRFSCVSRLRDVTHDSSLPLSETDEELDP